MDTVQNDRVVENVSLAGLPRILIIKKKLNESSARSIVLNAQKASKSIVQVLCEEKAISSLDLAEIVADNVSLPMFDLSVLNVDFQPETMRLLEADFCKKNLVYPMIRRGNTLFIAIADPKTINNLDQIKFKTSLEVEPIVVEYPKLIAAIEKMGGMQEDDLGDDDEFGDLDADLENLEVGDETVAVDKNIVAEANETPVVKFVNQILLDAIKKGASDIHMEPYEKFYRVRYRIDGELQEINKPPLNLSTRITARLKVISNMDISERRIPQDGRIKLKISNTRSIDFRVNSCPTIFGEKMCLRILDASSAMLGIDVLGYEDKQKKAYLKALSGTEGMILVTGPTGSGKTVSLYTGLNILNKTDVNISTAEDPAEINLPGINQVNMNPKAGLDFASTLRAFLRQDPDIIMVGEIRDLETASIAVKAAQTGHLVLSTLHTNDAPQTLERLGNMGIPQFSIATAVKLIIAQRLARRLCKCKVPAEIPKDILAKEGFTEEDLSQELKIFAHKGCDVCGGSGYKGRTGIYQVLPISDEIQRAIMKGSNSIEIADIARKDGINDIRRSALKKVMSGDLSLEEANSVSS